jgi:tripartite-type tricarboxylate transporter receptor subunit TctC
MKHQLTEQGAEVVANTPEQFAAILREDLAKWTKIVKDSGIRVD